MTNTNTLPKFAPILCVDDEPRVLDGLRLTLRRLGDVSIATGGAEGLAMLSQRPDTAVVISDMRMPGMDGAAFLSQVRVVCPDATRILLTGELGREAAVAAVNEGQIFRFLTKPCAPDKLIAAVEAGLRQHQLITAEKTLLQQTVLGSIRAMVDVLSLVNPVAFGRAGRIKRLAVELATAAGMVAGWELEAAALLSQIGFVSLPSDLVERAVYGEPLDAHEKLLLHEVPKVTQGLIGCIPRLENVVAIIAHATGNGSDAQPLPQDIAQNAAVLMLVLDFVHLKCRGEDADVAIETLRRRHGALHQTLLTHLMSVVGVLQSAPGVRQLSLRDVLPGMVMLDDLRTDEGTLLASSGYEVSQSFIDRMRMFGPGLLGERIRVSGRGNSAA